MTTTTRTRAGWLAALGLVVGGCLPTADIASPTPDPPGGPPRSPLPGPTATAAQARRPIIVDTDLDHSDIAAVLVLLRDPAVDVRAITIAGTGLVHCTGGRLVTRYLLDEMGTPDIPFGCGREKGGPDAREFPAEWRAVADTGYGLEMTPKVETGFPRDAVEILTAAIDSSPTPPLLVTLGPLTNLEDAFAANPSLVGRVAGVHAMLGTLDAPGNVFVDERDGDDPLEWNAFADPSAVAAVLATDLPIGLIPLDATDDVPVPADLTERLAGDHAGAGADLFYELLVRHPDRLRVDQGQQLWDELAALAVSAPALVTWEEASVVVGEGGRLTRDAAGRPIRFASAADRPAVETALLDALRRGGPRATPFQLAGSLTATWDGTNCTLAGSPERRGIHTLRFENPTSTPAGVTVVGLASPHPWSELVDLLSTLDPETTEIPAWITVVGSANDEQGTGVPVTTTMDLGDLTYGPVCATGAWPDFQFRPGQSFVVGSNVIPSQAP